MQVSFSVNGLREQIDVKAMAHAGRRAPRGRPHRHPPGLRAGRRRGLHRAAGRRPGPVLPLAVQADGSSLTTVEGRARRTVRGTASMRWTRAALSRQPAWAGSAAKRSTPAWARSG